MGSSVTPSSAPSAAFLAAFDARGGGRPLTFAEFMELALYHPELGYYRQNRPRVGYGPGTDFFTASTSGTVFGELVAAATTTLLGSADPRQFTFVEIGAESPGGILAGVEHPFQAVRTIPVGQQLAFSGQCVVFSNELFDAQPFRRFRFQGGAWRELGVVARAGALDEVVLDGAVPDILPPDALEGYTIDVSFAAGDLARRIGALPWRGLFLAFDYGKSWAELSEATPQGTARAYHRHTQSNDLLANPAEQDLTCHVCWDWLSAALAAAGFRDPGLETQEAFFIRHAGSYIAATSAAEAARLSQKKLSLLQLLHPSHLGQKFQVLHAQRF